MLKRIQHFVNTECRSVYIPSQPVAWAISQAAPNNTGAGNVGLEYVSWGDTVCCIRNLEVHRKYNSNPKRDLTSPSLHES